MPHIIHRYCIHPSNKLQQWLVIVLTFVSACATGLTVLDESGTDVNMTMPNQLIELPYPQSHDHTSTAGGPQTNCKCFSTFVDDKKLAVLSKGVVQADTYKCTRCMDFGQLCCLGKKPGTKSTLMTQFQRTSSPAMTQIHSTHTFLGLC